MYIDANDALALFKPSKSWHFFGGLYLIFIVFSSKVKRLKSLVRVCLTKEGTLQWKAFQRE